MMKSGIPIPLHTDAPSVFNPIHEDDYIAQIPRLLEIADVSTTVLNWGGSEEVSVEDWCGYLAEITGLDAKFDSKEDTLHGLPMNLDRMHERVGRTSVPWREGIRRMVAARAPELLRN
jgi:UDP-glucuronate 4-epimerase